MTRTTVPLWRRLGAGIAGLAAAGVYVFNVDGSDRWKIAMPAVALVAAAGLVHVRRLGPQLLARAAWWSNLVMGALLSLLGGSSEGRWGFVLAVACGAALLVAGGKGVAEAGEREAHAPAAFRASLLLLMVLALADAQTFLLMGILSYDHGEPRDAVVLGLAGAALAVGFVGLYRLSLWGAIVNVVTCAIVLLLDVGAVLGWSSDRGAVGVLSALQVACAAPMLVSLAMRRPLPRMTARARGISVVVTILGVVFVCGLAASRLVDFRLR